MATLHTTLKRRSWQKLWTRLDQFLLTQARNGVVLAVSGGPDSRALLEAVGNWPNRRFGRFLVASFDHAVRLESWQESQFVLMRARRLGFDVHLERRASMSHHGEMELRNQRYKYLLDLCHKHGFASICTAHHLDDNAEGFMMNLMGLGGGSNGSAMNEVTLFHGKNLIRPFLTLTKNDLRLTLNLAHIADYATDSLDEAQKGSRAMVRHSILPVITRNSPNLSKRLESFARKQAAQQNALQNSVKTLVEWQDDSAAFFVDHTLDPQIIEKSIKFILKELCPKRDLRSAAPVVKEIIEKISSSQKTGIHPMVGLDPAIKWFKVDNLNAKVYCLPGARLFFGQGKVVIQRI